MDDLILKTEKLGKQYKIDRQIDHPERSLREDLSKVFRRQKLVHDTFWALEEIELEARRGEAIGLIGPNGSGKSTLLKILARVTWPTKGRVELMGRVGALLEVGTGFHIDLTGRENIFLCGAILGMEKQEVVRRFDEIIAFSEMEEFLDVPVKRYSSGMFLRLAFSVMAHLNSEILIVDEIIAVGDQAFQRKCLKKMKSIADEGRTVLFVSHQLETVEELCTRVVWLEKGKLIADGTPELILESYRGKAALQDPVLT